ncbi:GGDEF domain-containing protein [Bacillus salacetis]|uniref:GGDEF domain-containing protein n=1 Tax=Bacillus salacetis TaxID=2315464 RepID=UPI003BA1EB2A
MIKKYLYQNESFTALKRKIYITLLPVFIAAFVLVLAVLYVSQGFIDPLNGVSFSLLIGGLTWCWLAIVKKPSSFLIIELFIFTIAASLFLLRMLVVIVDDLGVQGDDHLGTVAYWTAIYYFLVFFTFRGKGALVTSLLSFSIVAVTGAYHIFFSSNVNGDTVDTVIQYSVATLGTIITLFYIQRMIEGYLESEITKIHANTDYLTKLPNRRRIEQILGTEVKKHASNGTPFTVSMFDIDFFKKVNDYFGHDVGDSVLQELTALILAEKRENEYFGRWGGEEFLLIFAGVTLDESRERAETICTLIHHHAFEKVSNLTCSFGLAEYDANEELKDLLKRTDEALYHAKDNGRNRVECA